MPKKITVILLSVLLLLSCCSCGIFNRNKVDTSAQGELIKSVKELCDTAALQYDVGLTFQSEYLYGLAQAEISSLRLAIDTVLWLRGEGKNFAEVVGDAPYKSFDEIIGAGPGSDAPLYFEGLLYKFQGEDEKSEECYNMAAKNPVHKERDFYFLRKLAVKELYSLKEEATECEKHVCDRYTPRTALITAHTGAEFSPVYHLALASDETDAGAALQCALNALLTGPTVPSLYGAAASYAMSAGKVTLAVEILNDGLFLAPEDASVNYVAALYSHAKGDDTAAKTYLDTAKKSADGDTLASINALYDVIGG